MKNQYRINENETSIIFEYKEALDSFYKLKGFFSQYILE